ncbi:hypothetical protein [Clostridium sp.]|uniref:hypothetical protein n=1 Tax=Clostridium sp. TaxID=1506 RepID=UPI003F373FE1
MEDPKLTPLIIFTVCAAVNDNLDKIIAIYKSNKYIVKDQVKKIDKKGKLLKVNKNIKSIGKDLFK